MGLEHLYERIITVALGIPSCGCAFGNGSGDECRVFGEAAHSATQRPWASALDFACLTAKGARSANAALTAITQKAFDDMGFRYDTTDGSPSFLSVEHYSFDLSEYIRSGLAEVNCYDQAFGVAALGNILGTSAHVEIAEPFGFIETADLVGVGYCNNPFFTGEENLLVLAWQNGLVVELEVEVPRVPLVGVDSIQRSPFGNHAFTVMGGMVFDACAGPSLGTHSISNYIDNAVDHSTENERLNGFYSDVIPGRIVPLSSYFRIR